MRIQYRLPKINFGVIHRIFKCFGGHLPKHKHRIILASISMLGMAALTLMGPWPIKVVFDYILLPSSATSNISFLSPLADWDPSLLLGAVALTVLAMAVVRGILNYSYSVHSKIVGHRLVADIRMQLFSHVQRLPLSFHDYRESGELMTRMTGDISLVQNLLVSTVIVLVSQIVLLISIISIMFVLNWELALISVALIPFFAMAAFRFSVRIKSSAKRQREMYGKIIASIQESFAGISQVKSFAQEKQREKLIGKSVSRDVKANVKTTKLTANYARIVEIITALGTGLVLWLGVQKVLTGQISAGDLLIFLAYLRGIYRPLKDIAKLSTRIAKGSVRGEKLVELLEMKPEDEESQEGISAKGIVGEIQFDRVNFSYISGSSVLQDFSCKIPSQKTSVIIGPTGAGKSTIAKLIIRLYEPQGGAISLDGRDLNDYRIRSLRKNITPLTQETFLFRMSVADNIGFGKRRATREEIEQAAKMVGADEFIKQLPKGYDTLVGEGGATLSGGQRQRISFARAALRQAPIMIFDEPATGLDVHAEKEAKEVLRKLHSQKTLIIITHRLHFLDLADWVIFIKNGQLCDEGNPRELMQRDEEFKEFVAKGKDKTELAEGFVGQSY